MNIFRKITVYVPIYLVAIMALLIFDASAILPVFGFLILQSITVELSNIFLKNTRLDDMNIDFAPFAAILFAYYYSIPVSLISMFALLLIQDIDVDVNIFSEIEDVAFNVIIGILAFIFRSQDFLQLAIILIILRYFVLTIVHGFLTKDFSLRKFAFEGLNALIFIVVFRLLQAI